MNDKAGDENGDVRLMLHLTINQFLLHPFFLHHKKNNKKTVKKRAIAPDIWAPTLFGRSAWGIEKITRVEFSI